MKTPGDGGRPECARSRLGPPARPLPHVDASDALTANKGHNERGNETVTPHRSGAGQRTGVCSTCQPAQCDEIDGFGQRCARGRNARRHCLPGRPGGARTHPRPKMPSRARRERRERAAEKSPPTSERALRVLLRRGERSREHSLRRREREVTHSRQKTHSSPKHKRTTTGATSTSRAFLMARRSRASGWRSRAAAAG